MALRAAEQAEAGLGDERPCFTGGCQAGRAELPIPEGRIVAALDGGCVRNRDVTCLTDRGGRFRPGERVASCLAGSAVGAVISRRFAKRRPMQRTKPGAHLLRQTRTRTLDGTLRPLSGRWRPGLAHDNGNEATNEAMQAAAA